MKRFYLFFVAVLFFGLLFSSCDKLNMLGKIKYEVTCTPRGFDVTYTNRGGNTEQKDISGSRWSTSFTGDQGAFVYVSAQAHNDNANITVKIYYGGKIIKQAHSSGDYVIATASGSLP